MTREYLSRGSEASLRHSDATQVPPVAAPVWAERDYAFLVPALIDGRTLARACAAARQTGRRPEDVLVEAGHLTRELYRSALRQSLFGQGTKQWARVHGRRPPALPPRLHAGEPKGGAAKHGPDPRLHFAVSGLRRISPQFAASDGIWVWQLVLLMAMPGLVLGAAIVAPGIAMTAALALLTLAFALVVFIRLIATAIVLAGPGEAADLTRLRLTDTELPSYAVIVPLYREARIVPDCVSAVAAIDYPTDRLDVVFAVEADDEATRSALALAELQPHMRVVIIPPGGPRTKPKALNYVLADLASDYVVIFDAEDIPEPDQLRKAAVRFYANGDRLGCLQAKLNTYNWSESWLARQFSLEYSALFDGLLRALQHARLPVPLGGTSNHFPRALLQSIGGWDAYNVTEDADLGIRLARLGYRVEVLNSTTWEEAPSTLGVWVRQRSRWIKGWLQTYGVHTRQPFRQIWELGPWQFAGFHMLVGGLIASVFLHPLVYVLLAIEAFRTVPFEAPPSFIGQAFWWMAAFNLLAGSVTAVALAGVAAVRRGRLRLLPSLLTLPVYWLAISLAAYRAAWLLWRKPYDWEKTPHRARLERERRHGAALR